MVSCTVSKVFLDLLEHSAEPGQPPSLVLLL